MVQYYVTAFSFATRILSIASSVILSLTYLCFPELRSFESHVIVIHSFCFCMRNLIALVLSSSPIVDAKGILCSAEGFFQTFFLSAAFLWAIILAWDLYSVSFSWSSSSSKSRASSFSVSLQSSLMSSSLSQEQRETSATLRIAHIYVWTIASINASVAVIVDAKIRPLFSADFGVCAVSVHHSHLVWVFIYTYPLVALILNLFVLLSVRTGIPILHHIWGFFICNTSFAEMHQPQAILMKPITPQHATFNDFSFFGSGNDDFASIGHSNSDLAAKSRAILLATEFEKEEAKKQQQQRDSQIVAETAERARSRRYLLLPLAIEGLAIIVSIAADESKESFDTSTVAYNVLYCVYLFAFHSFGVIDLIFYGLKEKIVAPSSVEDVLDNDLSRPFLVAYAEQQLCRENIDFYLAVKNNFNTAADRIARLQSALTIIHRFVLDSAPQQINLSGPVQGELADAADEIEEYLERRQKSLKSCLRKSLQQSGASPVAAHHQRILLAQLAAEIAAGDDFGDNLLTEGEEVDHDDEGDDDPFNDVPDDLYKLADEASKNHVDVEVEPDLFENSLREALKSSDFYARFLDSVFYKAMIRELARRTAIDGKPVLAKLLEASNLRVKEWIRRIRVVTSRCCGRHNYGAPPSHRRRSAAINKPNFTPRQSSNDGSSTARGSTKLKRTTAAPEQSWKSWLQGRNQQQNQAGSRNSLAQLANRNSTRNSLPPPLSSSLPRSPR